MRFSGVIEQANNRVGYLRLEDGRVAWFAARDFNQPHEYPKRVRVGVKVYCSLVSSRGFLAAKSISLAD